MQTLDIEEKPPSWSNLFIQQDHVAIDSCNSTMQERGVVLNVPLIKYHHCSINQKNNLFPHELTFKSSYFASFI